MNKNLIIFIFKKETYVNLEVSVNANDFIDNKDHPVTGKFLEEQALIAKQNKILIEALYLDHEINTDSTLIEKNNFYFHITEHQFEYMQDLLQRISLTQYDGLYLKNYFTSFSIEDLIHQCLSFICQYNHEDEYFKLNPYQGFTFAFHESITKIIDRSFIAPAECLNLKIIYLNKN